MVGFGVEADMGGDGSTLLEILGAVCGRMRRNRRAIRGMKGCENISC